MQSSTTGKAINHSACLYPAGVKAALADEIDEDFSGVSLESVLVRKTLPVMEEQDQHICELRSSPCFILFFFRTHPPEMGTGYVRPQCLAPS